MLFTFRAARGDLFLETAVSGSLACSKFCAKSAICFDLSLKFSVVFCENLQCAIMLLKRLILRTNSSL